MRLLICLKGRPSGARDAMQCLGLNHRPTFLYDYLRPAIQAGFVQMTHPDSPRSPKHSLCEPSGTVAHNYIYIPKSTTTSFTIYFLCLILHQLSSLPSPISSNRLLKSGTSLPCKHPSPPPPLPRSSTGSSLSKPSMQLLPGTRASGG